DDVLTDVAPADPYERLLFSRGDGEAAAEIPTVPRLLIDEVQGIAEAAMAEAVPRTTYEPPPDGDLSIVTGAMTVTWHVSPMLAGTSFSRSSPQRKTRSVWGCTTSPRRTSIRPRVHCSKTRP